MEGYFPIYEYCELTGSSITTASHRASRGTVPAFQDKNGRWFLYHSDVVKEGPPKGFLFIRDYCKKNDVSIHAIRWGIDQGYISKDDYIKLDHVIVDGKCQSNRLCIRETFKYKKPDIELHPMECIMNACRPMGYLTVKEWAEREGTTVSNVYQLMYKHKIDFCKNFGHLYIHHSIKYERKWKNHDYKI